LQHAILLLQSLYNFLSIRRRWFEPWWIIHPIACSPTSFIQLFVDSCSCNVPESDFLEVTSVVTITHCSLCDFFSVAQWSKLGLGHLIVKVSISYMQQDRPERMISLLQRPPLRAQHTPNTRGKHTCTCSQWDKNLHSQQSSGFRPMPQKAQPLKSAYLAQCASYASYHDSFILDTLNFRERLDTHVSWAGLN
jgi:hypothetical protein